MNREKLYLFLRPLQILAFDDVAAAACGAARAELEASRDVIGPIDLLLASQALALG